MDEYLTSFEISAIWGVDARTVQNLCRNRKITGAVKRAGSWFIPKDAPSPLKNNKSNGERFHFIGTKKRVFDTAIAMFSSKGFENVSIRDISDGVEITQSTMYNHFPSKHDLLETIYDYYTANFAKTQKPIEEMKEILKSGSRDEFIAALMFTFEQPGGDESERNRMILITKIIYMRVFQDEKARDIFLELMNSSVENYVCEILEYGVAIGVLEEFDIRTCAKFLVGQRHIMGMKAFAASDYEPQQLEEEARVMKMSISLLPFVKK